MPLKSTDELLREYLEGKPNDTLNRIANDQIETRKAFTDWTSSHEKKDDDRHTTVMSAIGDVSKRVFALERQPRSMTPGEMQAVRSIMPPAPTPGDTGSFKVDHVWMSEVQRGLAELHTAKEQADQEKMKAQTEARLAEARQRGAEEATARARAEAEREKAAAEMAKAAAEAKRLADVTAADKLRAEERERLRTRLSIWGAIATFITVTIAVSSFFVGQSQRTPHHDAPSTVTAPAH